MKNITWILSTACLLSIGWAGVAKGIDPFGNIFIFLSWVFAISHLGCGCFPETRQRLRDESPGFPSRFAFYLRLAGAVYLASHAWFFTAIAWLIWTLGETMIFHDDRKGAAR